MDTTRKKATSLIDRHGINVDDSTEITPDVLGEIVAVGDEMSSMGRWARADATRLARDFYGDDWYQYLPFSVSERTLNNEAGIAKKFSRAFRQEHPLPFRYYERVRGMDLEDASQWLQRATQEQLTPDDMRELINADKEKPEIIKQELTVADLLAYAERMLKDDYGLADDAIIKLQFERPLEQVA